MISTGHIHKTVLFLGIGFALASSATNNPVGTWRGESKCLVKPSACRDEDSVYRVSKTDQPDKVNLSANKVVDGREVNMGSGDCAYDAKAGSLDCPLPNGNSIHFLIDGDSMEGKFTLRDGTRWRKISLRRDH